MRDFIDIASEYGLKEFIDSPWGTLYFRPDAYDLGESQMIVRRFNRDWPPLLVRPYADLIRATQRWIDGHPELAALVRVEQPLEVGRDFIARKHHVYYTSTSSYLDDEIPPEPPAELNEMRHVFQAARINSKDKRDKLVSDVLARSILYPSGKTFFEGDEGRFVIVEPKPTREELERWSNLMEMCPSPKFSR